MNTRKADGFALIDLLFVIALIGVLSTIALPRMLLARQSAGSASAIGSMRVIHSSQLTFALTCGAGFYAPNLTTLGHAPVGSHEAFISANLATANTVTKSVTVTAAANVPPTANFSFVTSGLTATFTDGSSDSDGSIASRSWNFGDSTTSTATNPAKTYSAAGTYSVQVSGVNDTKGVALLEIYEVP